MKPVPIALACLLLAACGTRGPLDGLSEKERRAAEAQALVVCNNSGKTKASGAELVVALGDLAVGAESGDHLRIIEAANALARQRGCVPH